MVKVTITQNRIFEAMKVEDESKGRLFKRLLATGAAPACKRCGGSGRYSYNYKDKSTCYGCGGAGIIIDSEAKLLEIVESKEIQDKLNTYLAELEAKKQPKQKAVTQPKETEQPKVRTENELIDDMFKDAIERDDWEFIVRIMVIQKGKGINIVESGKPATEKQINYIKSLVKKKTAKQQSDKDNLIKLIEDVEKGNKTLNHIEVNYIINWLSEK